MKDLSVWKEDLPGCGSQNMHMTRTLYHVICACEPCGHAGKKHCAFNSNALWLALLPTGYSLSPFLSLRRLVTRSTSIVFAPITRKICGRICAGNLQSVTLGDRSKNWLHQFVSHFDSAILGRVLESASMDSLETSRSKPARP